ncbi:hypothetical protein D623_10027626 [Myotis brandtii]|uniref:Uncharacterized protein n=1 Tax=Myotis brandtii TaxID=109478 RepID=S7PF64_MYOBR|nr:hypothetical protein D623_10027626 [Myotis brandtii]
MKKQVPDMAYKKYKLLRSKENKLDTWVIGSRGSATITTMNDQQLNCALDLMRHLPLQQIEIDLIDLVPV